jgi:hypothetical protein
MYLKAAGELYFQPKDDLSWAFIFTPRPGGTIREWKTKIKAFGLESVLSLFLVSLSSGTWPLPGGADVAAVALMKQWELDTISQFKTDGNFANLSHDDVQMMGLDQNKESLNITYTVTTGARTISYLFTTNEDTHGAHPNTFYHSFSFDTQNGNNLVLGSLFSPTSDYLTALSKAARAALPAVIAKAEGMTAADVDAGMLKDGTAPAPDNFANFMIDGKNLMIIFAPYQVAPYSAGTQRLSIPLSSLSGILKAEYR